MNREGTIHIVWLNRNGEETVPLFAVGFADYGMAGGAMEVRRLQGDDALRSFLAEIGIHAKIVEQVVPGVHSHGVADVVNVCLPESELAKLGLAS